MSKMYETISKEKSKCIVVVVCDNKGNDKNRKIDEITKLAESTDLEVVNSFSQNIREFNKSTVIGSGKLYEIKEFIDACEEVIDLAIIDYPLTASQARNISNIIDTRVIDRVGLIIDIFAMRAQSAEAKLQVKFAQDKYLIPRLADVKASSDRFRGSSVGMRGPGETKLELDKRKIEKEMDLLRKEINQVKKKREINRRERTKNDVKRVAIVGYTNAGKSTLLNCLTKENIYAEDKYFATLDTTSRKLFLEDNKNIIITDTVGFITDLPHELVDAFSSTLEEARDADLILHVVDPTQTGPDGDLYFEKNIEVTNKVLDEIGSKCERVLVFNKSDNLEESEKKKLCNRGVLISAKRKEGIDILKKIIFQKLFKL